MCHGLFLKKLLNFPSYVDKQLITGYADTSHWIGTATALAHLSNSCALQTDIGSPPNNLTDVVYGACGNNFGMFLGYIHLQYLIHVVLPMTRTHNRR